ncbi:hypothetical protein LBM2029_19205 (plasmid) [Ralstonia solanacearum]|nr:hypothetical protein LBM2029_19205 [Ralstonia solanacearum]
MPRWRSAGSHVSDFDFVARLLAEEGLFYVFEHEAVQGDALCVHRMVIADANDVFVENAQATIRFGRADATASEDVIDRWHRVRGAGRPMPCRSPDGTTASTRSVARNSACSSNARAARN